VIIGISSSSQGLTGNPFIGFICGINAMIFFSIKNLFARKAERNGIEMFKSVVICLFFEGISGFLNIGIMWFFVDIFGDTSQFWITLIAGVLFGIATIFVTFAVMAGKIGPSIMIANSMGIYQMALDYFIKGVVPGLGQLVGGVITIVGVAILLLWNELVGKSND
jgi:drug/metabolite transporter (DMT)-like permease